MRGKSMRSGSFLTSSHTFRPHLHGWHRDLSERPFVLLGHSSNPMFWGPPQYVTPLHNYRFPSMSKKTLMFQEVKSLGPSAESCDLSPGPTGAPVGLSEGRHTQCLFAHAREVGAACLPLPLPWGPHELSRSGPPALPRAFWSRTNTQMLRERPLGSNRIHEHREFYSQGNDSRFTC